MKRLLWPIHYRIPFREFFTQESYLLLLALLNLFNGRSYIENFTGNVNEYIEPEFEIDVMSDLEAESVDEAVEDSSSDEEMKQKKRRKLSYSLMYVRESQVLWTEASRRESTVDRW